MAVYKLEAVKVCICISLQFLLCTVQSINSAANVSLNPYTPDSVSQFEQLQTEIYFKEPGLSTTADDPDLYAAIGSNKPTLLWLMYSVFSASVTVNQLCCHQELLLCMLYGICYFIILSYIVIYILFIF